MEQPSPILPDEKASAYRLMAQQLRSLVEGCPLPLPALANASALLWDALPNINWAGFYLMKGDTLYLGPFQGKVACTMIPVGRGVCGTAAATRQVQIVPDVHAFPGHIACDSASRSEIVLPMIVNQQLIGVMDIDSPYLSRFDELDAQGLGALCQILTDQMRWEDGLL